MSSMLQRTMIFAALTTVLFPVMAQEMPERRDSVAAKKETSDFSVGDVAAAQQFSQTLGVAEWLGPMAPVALSPFFGIACLSGMSLYGQGWIATDNAFLGEGSPLHNPAVFWVFLGLTLLTSVPRFAKVSKPFAQAVDQVETWSGILTMVILRIMMGVAAPAPEQLDVAQLGFLSASFDVLMILAAAINIFVINAVKFFFEMMIWITPVPAIDAIFEVANKAVCGSLMLIYGYSPTIATVINFAAFFLCAIVFRWVYRREVFFRTVLLDAVLDIVAPATSVPRPEVRVFPTRAMGAIPARARCLLVRTESGWTLIRQRMFRNDIAVDIASGDCALSLRPGWITNAFELKGTPSGHLTFSRRFNRCLADLAEALGAACEEPDRTTVRDSRRLNAEMS